MGEEELKKEIRELRKQISELSEAMERITEPYQEVIRNFGDLQNVARKYFALLELYQKFGGISPEMVIPELRDPISREIVRILFDKGDRNISQIAEQMKLRRGTSSRRIIRERLNELIAENIVTVSSKGKTRRFSVSDAVVEKWSQVLGLPKYEGHVNINSNKKEGDKK